MTKYLPNSLVIILKVSNPHRSRMNPSRSKIIVDSNLSNNDPKVILKDLIDVHGLRFESKRQIFKV